MPTVRTHPAALFNPTAVAAAVLDLASDVDLTDPAGPTGGYCARGLLIGSTAGNVKYKDLSGNTVTQAVAADQLLQAVVQYVFSTGNGTTAATVTALV